MAKLSRLKREYDRLYSHLPDSDSELLQYIRDNWNISDKRIEDGIKHFNEINWLKCRFILPLVPVPAPRPRSSSNGHFYVKGAKEHKKYVSQIVQIEKIICTICKIQIKIYQPIPVSSMTNIEIYLAQLGLIRPTSGGDWDNFAKTYCDAIQNVIIINDNIICGGSCERYYSLKPKVEIVIEYQDRFDSKFNERKIRNSISFKNNKERIDI